MKNTELFQNAFNDYVKAQDLAIMVKERTSIFTKEEILIIQGIFKKWFLYFADKAKNANNKRQGRNFLYLKNRFLDYYRFLL